jgi:flavin-dependent dehydrogenase
MDTYPIVIIGAGPAGLSTALHLVRQDPAWAGRLILLDRSSHPRHKLCGGGLTRFGLQVLEDLDIPMPLPIPHAVVEDARFIYKDRTIHVRGRPEFIVFHRQEFDHFLAETAASRGITIHTGVRVRSLEQQPDGIDVITDQGTYRAAVVVGADGSRGVTRNHLAKAADRSKPDNRAEAATPAAEQNLAGIGRQRAAAAHRQPARVARLLEVVHPAPETAPQFTGKFASFDFTHALGALQGYGWDFPTMVGGAPHHNRGVYDARIAAGRPRAKLPAALEHTLQEFGSDPDSVHIEGHPIHWFSPRAPISMERLLLVGDAAGAEPLFGEGIAIALAYGNSAAAAIEDAFSRGHFDFKTYKRRVLASRLGRYLLLRWWVAWWSYRLSDRPWFMHIMWTIGKGLAAINNFIQNRAGG